MKSAFVVSDIHLTHMASPQGEALLSLLEKATREASMFVILGDLFDMWVGHAQALHQRYASLIAAFKKLKPQCRLIYFEGNHDFHLEKFWKDELGFEVFTGPQSLEFAGLKIRAEHGDEVNPNDRGYLYLRWFLRTPLFKFLAEHAPSKLVTAVGNRASHASRSYTSSLREKVRLERIIIIGRDHALQLRKTVDFNLLLTGHTHLADDFSFKYEDREVRAINLGSWFDGPHYLEITGEKKIFIHFL